MNEKTGNEFEKEVAEWLKNNGFWVLRIPHSRNGQPFDIIAVGNDKVFAVDCKTCLTDRFNLLRIEENQRTAMTLFKKLNPQKKYIACFAFKFADNSIVFVPYEKLAEIKSKTVTKKELEMMML